LSKDQKLANKKLKRDSKAWIKNVEKEINDNAMKDIERERLEHEAEV